MADLFYRYYDQLFADKEYDKEIESVLETGEQWGISPPQSILEIGCGTGNHTWELAKLGCPIVALDIDGEMISRARKKLALIEGSHVTFHHGAVESLGEETFDMAVALFNVITYIQSEKVLSTFFKAISNRLKVGGIFIFDCWNGDVALRDPPGNKLTCIDIETGTLNCKVTAETDFVTQSTALTYTLTTTNIEKQILEMECFVIPQRLWTQDQILKALVSAGMEVIACTKLFKFSTLADQNDWKIMFTCRRLSCS